MLVQDIQNIVADGFQLVFNLEEKRRSGRGPEEVQSDLEPQQQTFADLDLGERLLFPPSSLGHVTTEQKR